MHSLSESILATIGCDEAPVCCPLLGSDHFLCVAQSIPLPLGPSIKSEWKFPLRLGTNPLLCGPLPVSNRSPIVEEIFNNLITILQQHTPSQRQLPLRRQRVWWTLECFAMCVTRIGLSDCQELPEFFLVSLARSCSTDFPPGSVPTRPDCVRWPEGQDPLEQWRQHFMSVGARSSLLPMPRFLDNSQRQSFDALSRCVESAVGLDGLPYSLSKRMFPWWQSALVNLFNLVLAWGAIPS